MLSAAFLPPAGLQVTRTPVLGRILNPVTRGYSVGIGGIVAFLPMSQCLVRTAQRIGVLQPFVVSQVKRGSGFRGVLQPNVIVCDVEKEREVSPYCGHAAALSHLVQQSC